MKSPWLITAMLIGVAAYAAPALKPAQKEAQKKFEEEISAPLKATNDGCGTTLTVKTDFENLKPADWEGNSISSRCEAVLDGLQALCKREAYKDEIKKRVKQVACLFAGAKAGSDNDTTKSNMSLKGSVFTFKMHKDNANLTDNTQAVLEKALNE